MVSDATTVREQFLAALEADAGPDGPDDPTPGALPPARRGRPLAPVATRYAVYAVVVDAEGEPVDGDPTPLAGPVSGPHVARALADGASPPPWATHLVVNDDRGEEFYRRAA